MGIYQDKEKTGKLYRSTCIHQRFRNIEIEEQVIS